MCDGKMWNCEPQDFVDTFKTFKLPYNLLSISMLSYISVCGPQYRPGQPGRLRSKMQDSVRDCLHHQLQAAVLHRLRAAVRHLLWAAVQVCR